MQEHDGVSLRILLKGGAVELFDEELRQVANNILDPNTKATVARKVVLTLTLLPNEGRDILTTTLNVSSKLAPPRPQPTVLFVGRDRGVAVLAEKDTKQIDMYDDGPQRADEELR